MCIATTAAAAVATAIAVVAATATSTAVTLSQVSAQKKTAAYQIEKQKKEAKKAEMQAAYERQEGVEEARKQKLNAILSMADEKAQFAGSNIALSSSTVLNLENDAKINSELDALTTQQDAERRAQAYMDRRNSLYANTALTAFNTGLNSKNSYMQLGSGLLTSATKFAK